MERMLRKKKDNSDYEIDRKLTGKFAIEKNAEYQEKIEELEEENKNLNDDLRYYKEKSEFLNNVIVNFEKENKKLKEELSKYKKQYEHSLGGDDEEGLYD